MIGIMHIICLSATFYSNDSRDVAFLIFSIIFYIISALTFLLVLFEVVTPSGQLQRFVRNTYYATKTFKAQKTVKQIFAFHYYGIF